MPEHPDQPPAAPPPAAPPPAAPPPAAPPPAAPPHQPPPAPATPKKRRTGCIIGAVLLVLFLICSCIAAAGALIYFSSGNAKGIVQKADKEYEDALATFESMEPVFKLIGEMEPAQIQKSLKEMGLNAEVNEAMAGLDAAETEIDKLGDSASDVKAHYKASLTAARAALGDLRKMGSILGQLAGTSKYLMAMKDKVENANAKLEESIDEANDKDYSRARSLARDAERLYRQAETTLRSEHRKNPDLEFDRAADVVAMKVDLAELAADMADYGARGRTSSYNDTADRFNSKNKELDSVYIPPVLRDPNVLIKDLTDVYASFTRNVALAEQRRKQALAALED